MRCRACDSENVPVVLDLGRVAPADLFPPAESAVEASETGHDLVMGCCADCALAQLLTDDTTTEQPLGVEPQALRDHAEDAIGRLVDGGWIRAGQSVAEFTSPHGGSWTPVAVDRGLISSDGAPADAVLDSLGVMHDHDQRAAFTARAAATAPGGTLFLHFHSLATIVRLDQWMSLRHGHYAYYSLSALRRLLADAGMSVVEAWEFDLYGGTVLVAARHGWHEPSATVSRILDDEHAAGVDGPSGLQALQASVGAMVDRVRAQVDAVRDRGGRLYAYGAASRAVAVFTLAGLTAEDITAVADSSSGKQGRRMPGTDIPIIAPSELVDADPESVWLTLPDLRSEVSAAYPTLADRFVVLD
ncbi:class I SAM-dependent methyltransferase [Gordonia soli]|uniref:Transferase n=1 Tax=Gordonia soli NBRC 108243 TaxID=1223545 RepID=M0QL74_9ACTN|nr:class I SAM-dependent methyltransferase [Gordonia soli]GAC69184.1 hypothetical protein GS4_22_00160 [Gordonia soli NBRC 108243]